MKGGENRKMGDCDCNVCCMESLAIEWCGYGNLLQTKLNLA